MHIDVAGQIKTIVTIAKFVMAIITWLFQTVPDGNKSVNTPLCYIITLISGLKKNMQGNNTFVENVLINISIIMVSMCKQPCNKKTMSADILLSHQALLQRS